MRKKIIAAILPVILLSAACAHTDIRPSESDIEARSDNDTDMPPSAVSGNEICGYQKIYMEAVKGNTDSYTSFSLIYLDDDDIPEMVVYNSYYLCYSVYTVKGGALFCMADSLNTVELTYFERTGILCEFFRWNGGGDEGGYGRAYYQAANDRTLTNSDTPILNYVYNAVYDEENVYTGEGITEYYHMGRETDEASYMKIQDSLEIADVQDKACAENALEREEMLGLLSEN